MAQGPRWIAGAMSGTSADGVDVAIVRVDGCGLQMTGSLEKWSSCAYPPTLKADIFSLRAGNSVSLETLARVGREISLCYARAVNEALAAMGMEPRELTAVAAHGQTLFHQPPLTMQWLDPALVAAEVRCQVISDFRRADCAAGGQGAPLVPLADYLLFRSPTKNRVLLNIGGIANLTFLAAGAEPEAVIAFDTGPGNCISDYLMRAHSPTGRGWDEDGAQARLGVADRAVVDAFLSDAYFQRPPPKSTDGPQMIATFEKASQAGAPCNALRDWLRTACHVAARAVADALNKILRVRPDEVIASGGGTSNRTLMHLLREMLGGIDVRTSDELGMPSSAKEAVAFALLGAATLDHVPGNIPAATGAARAVVLGAVTPCP